MKAEQHKGYWICPQRRGKKIVFNVRESRSNMVNLNSKPLGTHEAAEHFIDMKELRDGPI